MSPSNNEQAYIDRQLAEIEEFARKYRTYLPKPRPPVVLVTGAVGNGKTTTINTFFGEKKGHVGQFTTGTAHDEIYEWQRNSENIHIVDLPGLGDRPKNEAKYQEIYQRWAKKADSFLIVVIPPRPAGHGAIRTVQLLLDSGVSPKSMIFGLNKLSALTYEDGQVHKVVKIEGLAGVTDKHEQGLVEQQKAQFLRDLQDEFPTANFSFEQIIEYDSQTGWNLYKMMRAVLEIIPFETIGNLEKVVAESHEAIQKKENEQIQLRAQLLKQLDEKEKQEKKLKEGQEALRLAREKEEQQRKDLIEANQRAEKAKQDLEDQKRAYERLSVTRVVEGIAKIADGVAPGTGQRLRDAWEGISTVASEAKKGASQVFNSAKKKFLSLFGR